MTQKVNTVRQTKVFNTVEVEMVDRFYHSGFTFTEIVETFAISFEYSQDEAGIIVSEIFQASS